MGPPTVTVLGLLASVLWPLLLLPLGLRFLASGRSGEFRRWSTRTDLGLALLCGVVASTLSTLWMPRYFMDGWGLSAWDFTDYCGCLGAFRGDPGSIWNLNRSLVAGLLPSLLARRLGVFDALLVSAVLSHVGIGAGIYLWGRALHGRAAGIAAVLISCAVAPLAELPRTITFYPEIVAVCILSAAGATAAIRFRTLPAIAAGSVGIGWVLLMDFRGLLFALPELTVVVAAACWPARGGNPARVIGLAVLSASLLVSWYAGSYAYHPHATGGLEAQTLALAAESGNLVGDDTLENQRRTWSQSGFVWGYSSPIGIPRSLIVLLQVARAIPDRVPTDQHNLLALRTHLLPWFAPSAVAAILLSWGLRRRLDVLAGFLVTCVPFVVILWVGTRVWAQPRYLSHGMAIVPVLLGAGFAVLLHGERPFPRWRGATATAPRASAAVAPLIQRPVRVWLAIGLLALCVLGVVPSWIGPRAPWRRVLDVGVEPYRWAEAATTGGTHMNRQQESCVSALRADIDAGLPVTGRLFPLFPRLGLEGPAKTPHKPAQYEEHPDSKAGPGPDRVGPIPVAPS